MKIEDVKANLTAKLDAKVDAGIVVPYWRKFLKLTSIRWSIYGFFSSAMAAGGTTALALPWADKLPHIIVYSILACAFVVIMYKRMTAQPEKDNG